MNIKLENTLKIIKKSVLFKIYIEGLYFKIILFFLFFSYFGDEPLIFLGLGIIFLLFNGMIKENINFIRSISIFIGLWIYIVNSSLANSFLAIPTKNLIIIILFSILIIPLLVYFYNIYGKNILKKLGSFLFAILPTIFVLSIVFAFIFDIYYGK